MNITSILLLSVAPHISAVVVYPNRAQVTRAVAVPCAAHATVLFEGIPPSADAGSFRARTNVGTIEGLRSEERTRKEAFLHKVEELDAQLRRIDGEQAQLVDGMTRNGAARTLAGHYSDATRTLISREMMDALPNVKGWSQALELALATRNKAAGDDVERQSKMRELARKRQDVARRRARLQQAAARMEYVAEVLIACPEGKTAEVELSYFVGGAEWSPGYEARADEGRGEVELATYATVAQSTGEDWKGVNVVLSTAIPRQNATPPEIQPLRLWVEERKAEKKVLVGRQELTQHAETSSSSDAPADAGGKQGMNAAAQGLSVQLVVPEASDVAGDGTPTRLLVSKNRMKAEFAARTVPKLMPFVFRVADLSNSAPFPFLAGTLDAFRKDGLIGRYPLERVAEGQRFHLTFGIDEAFKVKRQMVQESVRDKGFLGGTRRFRYAYHFDAESHVDRPQTVELSEPIPVSELDDVKVSIDPKATSGYELKTDDGIVTWKLKLAPGEKKSVNLIYNVDVPSSYDSGAP